MLFCAGWQYQFNGSNPIFCSLFQHKPSTEFTNNALRSLFQVVAATSNQNTIPSEQEKQSGVAK